ncbi:NAD-binding protein [Streptomyces sp. TR1341]|uniref:NAD-binding protein n=1 Tax=Streptomyces sp. TR1341 TaxID=2601266 RepID=UPI00138ADC71|nr:NAD-binding protein [Streptomyces sp. TR1341]
MSGDGGARGTVAFIGLGHMGGPMAANLVEAGHPTSPADRDYRPGFAAALMAKDLKLAADAVKAGGVHAELGLRAAELYAAYAERVGAAEDFSGIVRTIREQSGERA